MKLPIFPLPDVVLFPNVFLPLHIFEPRYREMVADAISGDRIVGMVLLKPGWEADYEGRPPIYPIGCAGLITHAERLQTGRYNIILRGLEKFRILGEEPSHAYRVGIVETVNEPVGDAEHGGIRDQRRRLEALIVPSIEGATADLKVPPAMRDEDLVNALAQHLAFEPVEKQALLECDGTLARCNSLIDLLEMKVMVARSAWPTRGTH
ncbi:MAG: LON peptidase substrate-binding domain-containing protein [Acidobacteria bacterium]|nr:LON peptidase substrate-binding domain-containing protein [Acidobacteriota bacterium]